MSPRTRFGAAATSIDEALAGDEVHGKGQGNADVGQRYEEPSPLRSHADASCVTNHPNHEYEPCDRHVDAQEGCSAAGIDRVPKKLNGVEYVAALTHPLDGVRPRQKKSRNAHNQKESMPQVGGHR